MRELKLMEGDAKKEKVFAKKNETKKVTKSEKPVKESKPGNN